MQHIAQHLWQSKRNRPIGPRPLVQSGKPFGTGLLAGGRGDRLVYKEDECQRRKLGSCEGGCSPAGTDVPLKLPLLVEITSCQTVSLCSQLED